MWKMRRVRAHYAYLRRALLVGVTAALVVGVAGQSVVVRRIAHAAIRRIHGYLNVADMGLLVAGATLLAAIAIPIAIAVRQRDWTRIDNAEARRSSRDRDIMLRRVENKWVGGTYHRNISAKIQIAIFFRRWYPQSIAARRNEPRFGTNRLIKLLDEIDGGLLILGAPGAGKTTLLQGITAEFVRRARSEPEQPIPVIFLLSSWGRQQASLSEWLVEELTQNYDVPKRTALRWIEENEILPLLDGLDEVEGEEQVSCVEAINRFKHQNGLSQFVVCSRTDPYVAIGQYIAADAVEIQPLTRHQVTGFLDANSATGVLNLARRDPSFWSLLETPLGLRILMEALPSGATPAPDDQAPSSSRIADVFAVYVERMFEQRIGRYERRRTLRWLSWLATSMRSRSETEFHIERLKPDWLPTRRLSWIAITGTAVLVGVTMGASDFPIYTAVYGLHAAIGNSLAEVEFFTLFVAALQTTIAQKRLLSLRRMIMALCGGFAIGVAFWLQSTPADGIAFGSFFAIAFGAFGGMVNTDPVEEYRWSWRRAAWGWCAGMSLGVIVGFMYGEVYGLLKGIVSNLEIGIPFGIALGIFSSLAGGVTPGLSGSGNMPNEAIHRSARLAVIAGISSMLVAGLAFTYVFSDVLRMTDGVGRGIRDGILLGVAVGLLMGGIPCIRHLIIRCMLVLTGSAPGRYVRFLNEASSELFLRRTGSGYMFVHGLLQDYLADLPKE